MRGVKLYPAYAVGSGGGPATVSGGQLAGSIGANSAVVLLSGHVDLTPAAAPANLIVTAEGNGEVALAWDAAAGAGSYNVYRSPLTGGGFVLAGNTAGTTFTDAGLANGQSYYYVVTSVDAAGIESAWSKGRS